MIFSGPLSKRWFTPYGSGGSARPVAIGESGETRLGIARPPQIHRRPGNADSICNLLGRETVRG